VYKTGYIEQISKCVRLFSGRQYRKIVDAGIDHVKHRFDPARKKNIFLLDCLDMEPVRDINDFGAISSYLSCYLTKDRSDGILVIAFLVRVD
jgi:hypothetical protein